MLRRLSISILKMSKHVNPAHMILHSPRDSQPCLTPGVDATAKRVLELFRRHQCEMVNIKATARLPR